MLWFAGWKKHYSLYPVNGAVVEALKKELAPYELAKGTARFPLSQPVPEKLIRRIAKLKAGEAGQPAKARTAPARTTVTVPPALRAALKSHPDARAAFAQLAPSHRKAYAQWVSSARRTETQERRAASSVQMLLKGKTPP